LHFAGKQHQQHQQYVIISMRFSLTLQFFTDVALMECSDFMQQLRSFKPQSLGSIVARRKSSTTLIFPLPPQACSGKLLNAQAAKLSSRFYRMLLNCVSSSSSLLAQGEARSNNKTKSLSYSLASRSIHVEISAVSWLAAS